MKLKTKVVGLVCSALLGSAVSLGVVAAEGKKHDKTIVVALSGPLKPYNYLDEAGKWKGLQADLLSYAADKAGYDLEYREMAFENEIPALIGGRVDIGSGIYITNERSEHLDFIPLVESYFGIISTKEFAQNVKDWTAFCGKKIGMHFSAPTERAVKEMNQKYCGGDNGAIPTPSSGGIMDRLNSVQNARTEGAIDDVNMWWAATESIPHLAVALDQVGDPLFWPIAFKKGSKLREELLPHVKEFLNSPRAEEVSLRYGMERNVFIKEDPDAVVQNVLESRRRNK
ncbi:MAG: transporter substrate-binding domain-containing protein [Candidimonas sp.]